MQVVFQLIYVPNMTLLFIFSVVLCCNVLTHLFISQHFFASFLSRDEAFKIINDGWSRHSNGAIVMEQKVFATELYLDTSCLLIFVPLLVYKHYKFVCWQ